MSISDAQLKDALLAGDYVSERELQLAIEKQQKGESLEALLKREGLVSDDIIGQAIAETFGVAYVDLGAQDISAESMNKLHPEVAQTHRAVFVSEKENKITITTDNPKNPELVKQLKTVFPGKEIRIAYSLAHDIDQQLVRYRQKLDTRFQKILEKEGRIAPELLSEIFEDAFIEEASDIHFEPFEKDVTIRFRVDGVLYQAGTFPRSHYEPLINKVKVLSQLRIDEHFSVQDGALRYVPRKQKDVSVQKPIDMRVSIVPTLYGEKIALRILSQYTQGFGLRDLGLSEEQEAMVMKAANKPFGMILVTGPTGSGKSTTLYALLKHINTPNINITTIEDPVEYKIEGVNQIQVNRATELTFAKGLRSIVRQDPDVILVGEIRDEETADIAVTAALTGHRLLSTFHANNAATSIPRLRDMNIEPFLLASTLELVVAQRLVRRICDNCRVSYEMTGKEIGTKYEGTQQFFGTGKHRLYYGKGCNVCGDTGFQGRIAIFEFIEVDGTLEALILNDPSTEEVWSVAQKNGASSMFADGMRKVKEGVTTFEEVLRVVDASEYGGKHIALKSKPQAKKKVTKTHGKKASEKQKTGTKAASEKPKA